MTSCGVTESYTYTPDGYLSAVYDGPAGSSGTLVALYGRNGLGEVVTLASYDSSTSSSTISAFATSAYDLDGNRNPPVKAVLRLGPGM